MYMLEVEEEREVELSRWFWNHLRFIWKNHNFKCETIECFLNLHSVIITRDRRLLEFFESES